MERLLQDIIDTLPVGVWVSDATGQLVRSNPAARRIWCGADPPAAEDSERFEAWWRQACERFASQDWSAADALANGGACAARTIDIVCFDGSAKPSCIRRRPCTTTAAASPARSASARTSPPSGSAKTSGAGANNCCTR